MGQSTFIVGAVMLAFLVWVTLRGNLGNYLADLGISGGAAATPNAGSENSTSPFGGIFDFAQKAGAPTWLSPSLGLFN